MHMKYTSVIGLLVTLKSLFFNGLIAVFHLCIILCNFLVCNILLNLFVAMSGFGVRIVNVQFLLSSLVCLAWVVFSDHFITKSCDYQKKYLLGYLFVFLRPLRQFFKGSELYFCHILILHCTAVVLVYKKVNLPGLQFSQSVQLQCSILEIAQ